MVDPLPNYFAMLSGLTKATRARARAAAQALVSQAGLDDVAADATELIAKMTEEITGASRANRELLENLIAAEVDRAASRLGFARSSELSALRVELTTLTARLVVLESRTSPADTPAPAKKTSAKKAPAKKTPAKKASTADPISAAEPTSTVTEGAAQPTTPVKKSTPAKKATAKKTTAAKKATSTEATGD